MTGRWREKRPDAGFQHPVSTCASGPSVRSVFLACPEVTGRWESPISDDRTRPVAEKRRWNLSVSVPASGRYDLHVRSVRVLPSEGIMAILALGAIKGVCGRPWAGC